MRNVFNKLKGFTSKAKTWLTNLFKKIMIKVKSALDKIKKFLMKSLDIALDLFGVKMVAIGDGYRFKGF